MKETRDPAPSPHALGLLSSFILFCSIENSKRSDSRKTGSQKQRAGGAAGRRLRSPMISLEGAVFSRSLTVTSLEPKYNRLDIGEKRSIYTKASPSLLVSGQGRQVKPYFLQHNDRSRGSRPRNLLSTMKCLPSLNMQTEAYASMCEICKICPAGNFSPMGPNWLKLLLSQSDKVWTKGTIFILDKSVAGAIAAGLSQPPSNGASSFSVSPIQASRDGGSVAAGAAPRAPLSWPSPPARRCHGQKTVVRWWHHGVEPSLCD